MLPEFIDIFELATPSGAVIPFEQWPMPRIFRGEKLRNHEMRIRRIGTDWERTFSYSGRIMKDRGMRLAFLIIADVTAHTAAQTPDATEVRQRDTQKAAALGALSNSITHELNMIFSSIMGDAWLALEALGPGHPLSEDVQKISIAAAQAKYLVQQIEAEACPLATGTVISQVLQGPFGGSRPLE